MTGCSNKCPYYSNYNLGCYIGCLKPDGVACPVQSTTYEIPYSDYAKHFKNMQDNTLTEIDKSVSEGVICKEDRVSAYAKRCIICSEPIVYNTNCDELVCEDCKNAISWIKRTHQFFKLDKELDSSDEDKD